MTSLFAVNCFRIRHSYVDTDSTTDDVKHIIITTCCQGEVSVSSVLGSAVFNITLVIALCSLASPRPLPLHWYPVCR